LLTFAGFFTPKYFPGMTGYMPNQALSDLSEYIYGTTRLGDSSIPFDERVSVARAAIDKGLWIHTSNQYGDALQVLRAAYDRDRTRLPSAIFKIGWDSVDQVRDVIKQNIEPLAIEKMVVGQLCLGGALAEDFRMGGVSFEGLNGLKDEGLVDRYVLELWPWNSDMAIDALRADNVSRLVDGFIFYLNPLQRFVTNDLWDMIHERDVTIIAMRTVCGGSVKRLIENPKAPEYLRKRAVEVAPIFERSGCTSWTEFCVRFAFGFAQVQSTVGSTSQKERLAEFVEETERERPLDPEIHDEIVSLQRRWSDEHDVFAEPWSM